MAAKGWSADLKACKFTYDFAVHGGAVGTILLGELPDSFVVTHCVAVAETALTGGGSMVVGNAGDADGYWTDIDAIAVATPVKGSGALVNSTGAEVMHKVTSANDDVTITIATTAYTAGKVHFFFIGVQAA